MNGGIGQRARVDAAVMRELIEQDRRWFADMHAELRQMRDIFAEED